MIEFYDIFKSRPGISLQDRLKEVYQQSQKHDANYEGILGYIKNFNWSIRPDGGYDCSTEIISTGEILESLKVNYSVNYKSFSELQNGLLFTGQKLSNGKPLVNTSIYGANIQKAYESSIISGIASELIFYIYSRVSDLPKGENMADGISLRLNDATGLVSGKKGSNLHFFALDLAKEKDADKTEKVNGIEPDKQIYIDLESLVNILSYHVVPVDKTTSVPIVPISTKQRNYDNEAESDLLCLFDPLQISVDPTICLIKNELIQYLPRIKQESSLPVSILPTYAVGDPKAVLSIFAFKQIGIILSSGNKYFLSDETSKIQLDIEAFINICKTRGIDRKEATMLLADGWEEYKYKNINPTPAAFTNSNQAADYIIGDRLVAVSFVKEEFRQPPATSKEEAKNKIAKYSFKDLIEYRLDKNEALIKLALGENYKNEYAADPKVSSQAANNVIAKIDAADTAQVLASLDTKSINFLRKLTKKYQYISNSGTSFGTIGSIYINLNNILDLSKDGGLEANDVKEKREINLYDFLKKLINQVQGSIGSLNNFDIHVDPIDGIARIIDINYVNETKADDAFNTAFTFVSEPIIGTGIPKLNGLFNNVRSYKINSQIFKEQSSIVAISAQNGGGTMGLDNETLVGFNKGITNRLLPNTGPNSAPSYNTNDSQTKLISTLNSSLSSLYKFLTDLGWVEDKFLWFDKTRKYNLDNTDKYKNSLRDLIMAYRSFTKTDSSFKSIIPTTVSLELDGIGGLIIGHLFRLPPELLPAGYKGGTVNGQEVGRKLGYIVTRLGHKISNSDWITQLEAQTIILEDSTKTIFNLSEALNAAKQGNAVVVNTSGNVTVNGVSTRGVPAGIIKKETTDINNAIKQVIDNLEGGYFHPNMLKDGRVKDTRYNTSGETMFGIDRQNSSARITNSQPGKKFWSIIDSNNAANNWIHNFIPKDPTKTQLLNLAIEAIKIDFNYLIKYYVKNPNVKQLILSDGRLLFNFIYASYNGEGWFDRFVKLITDKYTSGITSSDKLVKIFVDARIQSKSSLIAQTGAKIGVLVGTYV